MKSTAAHRRALKWGLIGFSMTVFAFISILVVSGCSNNPLTSSDAVVQEDQTSFFDLPFDEEAFAKRTDSDVSEYFWVESFLKEAVGGTIVLSKHEFTVGAKSFPTDTTFSIEITVLADGGGVVYDFGPDGLAFSSPAVLTIDVVKLYGKNATSVDFLWLNESTNLWELQGTYKADVNGFAHVPIEHFSKYGSR